VAEAQLKSIVIKSVWLAAEDYPRLLGSCDVGVCLHYSSSGVDLPMKVVDMFGCALPVCAIRFPAIDELVQHGVNGLLFERDDDAALARDLKALLQGSQLPVMRQELEAFRRRNWEHEWNQVAAPVMDTLVPPPQH